MKKATIITLSLVVLFATTGAASLGLRRAESAIKESILKLTPLRSTPDAVLAVIGGRSDGVGTLIVKKAGAHRVEDRRRSEGGPIASDKGAFWPGWTT